MPENHAAIETVGESIDVITITQFGCACTQVQLDHAPTVSRDRPHAIRSVAGIFSSAGERD